MNPVPDYLKRYSKHELLHPKARAQFEALTDACLKEFKGTDGIMLNIFESYRSPVRQAYLFNQVPKVTKAEPWESAHNYGLASDYVFRIYRDSQWQWSWEDDLPWPTLRKLAEAQGLLVPITWDRGHVEHPLWRKIGQYVD